MKRKILSLILALAMGMSLAACGGDKTTDGGAADASFKVGVIHIGDPADGTGYS